jgi:hypothetical protein
MLGRLLARGSRVGRLCASLVVSTLILTGCNPGNTVVQVRPFNLPIEFTFDSHGHISVGFAAGFLTPLGEVTIETPIWSDIPNKEQIAKTDTLISIDHPVESRRVRDRYLLSGQGVLAACLDGIAYQEYRDHEVVIVLLGKSTRLRLVQPGNPEQCAGPLPVGCNAAATAGDTAEGVTSAEPSYICPLDQQTLAFGSAYTFRVTSVVGASGYLFGFFQNGAMVWENYRDEGHLSGTEYSILPRTRAHASFHSGQVDVWVRALVNGAWTDARIITIYLN